MSDKNNLQRIVDICVDQLGVDAEKVTLESRFCDDLGADSLDQVELVMALEEEFGIEISDEEAEGIQSVQHALDLVNLKKS